MFARCLLLLVTLLALLDFSAAMDDFPRIMVSSSDTAGSTLLLVIAGLLAALRLM